MYIFLIIFFLLQYLYVELATKERPHHHAGGQTPAFTHARHVKDMVSEVRYLRRLFSMLNCLEALFLISVIGSRLKSLYPSFTCMSLMLKFNISV